LIKIHNLVKKYENLLALNEINLEVFNNEVFGLLGPNGAGKTTLIHILATLLKPTSGTAIVNGFDIVKNPSDVRSSIGIVFQAPSSDDMLTAYENLKLHSMLYSVPKSIREKRILEVLELVGLIERKDHQVKKFSGGMRRRLELARGLLHKPKVIFLDEPTLGLDPKSRGIMWDYIKGLVQSEKITLVMTTHYMEEADLLCDRIGFINGGKIIALGSPTRLKQNIGGDIIDIEITNKSQLDTALANIKHELKQFEFVRKVEFNKNLGNISVHVDDASINLVSIVRTVTKDSHVGRVDLRRPTLNDVFLEFTGKEILDNDTPEGGFMEKFARYNENK
jgi:ABC-2 type transport system ATP-binding protein